MKPYTRADRVSCEIQKTLSDLLHKTIKDPRIKMTTITGVKMSRDLRIARIYFTAPVGVPDSESGGKEALEGFKSAQGYIKRSLASRLGLRYMPELIFFYDDSFDYGSKIDSLLKRVGKEHE